jgi:hypothetical protein
LVTLDAERDEPEIEALRIDRYLESILVARERGTLAALHDPRLDAELRATAERLSSDLVRVHPSFRFEERLARRLADAGGAVRLPALAGAEPSRPRPHVGTGGAPFDPADLFDPARLVNDDDPFGIRTRPLLIGGALTSAAISLAGAALVAWRLSRPVHPMVRAIRAAHGRAGHQGGLA